MSPSSCRAATSRERPSCCWWWWCARGQPAASQAAPATPQPAPTMRGPVQDPAHPTGPSLTQCLPLPPQHHAVLRTDRAAHGQKPGGSEAPHAGAALPASQRWVGAARPGLCARLCRVAGHPLARQSTDACPVSALPLYILPLCQRQLGAERRRASGRSSQAPTAPPPLGPTWTPTLQIGSPTTSWS